MLADAVRTDRRRLTPLAPDGAATVALRSLVLAPVIKGQRWPSTRPGRSFDHGEDPLWRGTICAKWCFRAAVRGAGLGRGRRSRRGRPRPRVSSRPSTAAGLVTTAGRGCATVRGGGRARASEAGPRPGAWREHRSAPRRTRAIPVSSYRS
ncbi:hypothetical protein ACFO1B_41960 [Dactylosporangium siamense]|uniref:hypothetical protein n=1 Tax=Dactylosporangium siamense TaxID=685454 RepID=UPI0023B2C803|nr:hypothetical protein [Dactylosporangium siamense]